MLYLCTVEMMVEDFTGMRRKIYCSEEEKYLLRREKFTAPKRKNIYYEEKNLLLRREKTGRPVKGGGLDKATWWNGSLKSTEVPDCLI